MLVKCRPAKVTVEDESISKNEVPVDQKDVEPYYLLQLPAYAVLKY